jgi:TRAP-type C4-dicarboxylate transport system substrate-binding protein
MPRLGVSSFAERVAQKTGGNLVFETSFDACAGFKSADMVDAVQTRKVDAADAFAGGVANKYPLFAVSSLPFLADSLPRAQALLKRCTPGLRTAHGQKLLYTTPWPASAMDIDLISRCVTRQLAPRHQSANTSRALLPPCSHSANSSASRRDSCAARLQALMRAGASLP